MPDERTLDPVPGSHLAAIDADRVALARRARMPSWWAPALGAVTASWVASAATARPDGADGTGGTDSWYLLLLVAVALTVAAVRSTGVRLRGLGARGWAGCLALLAGGLLLYSTALGLTSLGLRWWVAVPTLLMFGATVVAVRSVDASARRSLFDGR